MESYWNRRAREDAFHFVDSREWRRHPDLEAFWRGGEEAVDNLLADLGITLTGQEAVLEIGCGVGRLTRALAHRVTSVHALDVSEEMLVQARQHNPHLDNVEWVHGDGTTLAPLSDEAFDACLSYVVFQHLPDPELTYGYVREMGRVLRPGGWAAFQVSNDARSHERPSGLLRLRHPIKQSAYHHRAWRGSAVNIRDLRLAASQSGLDIERIENEGTLFCLVLARRTARPAA
jgi:ubiquinone/menaquinone biosynthesis C-methylase UbiE